MPEQGEILTSEEIYGDISGQVEERFGNLKEGDTLHEADNDWKIENIFKSKIGTERFRQFKVRNQGGVEAIYGDDDIRGFIRSTLVSERNAQEVPQESIGQIQEQILNEESVGRVVDLGIGQLDRGAEGQVDLNQGPMQDTPETPVGGPPTEEGSPPSKPSSEAARSAQDDAAREDAAEHRAAMDATGAPGGRREEADGGHEAPRSPEPAAPERAGEERPSRVRLAGELRPEDEQYFRDKLEKRTRSASENPYVYGGKGGKYKPPSPEQRGEFKNITDLYLYQKQAEGEALDISNPLTRAPLLFWDRRS